jgi:hypothetical protein
LNSILKYNLCLLKATNHRIYDELHNWLIFGSSVDEVTRMINDDTFGTSTEFTIAVPCSVGGYDLFDAYNPWKERGAKLNITYMGSWRYSGLLNVSIEESKFLRRSNMFGIILKVFFFAVCINFYTNVYKNIELIIRFFTFRVHINQVICH